MRMDSAGICCLLGQFTGGFPTHSLKMSTGCATVLINGTKSVNKSGCYSFGAKDGRSLNLTNKTAFYLVSQSKHLPDERNSRC